MTEVRVPPPGWLLCQSASPSSAPS